MFATLLRLRQICAHPILIQEQGDGDGFVHADEEGGDHNSELARAARLVSMDFVSRMKQKFKDIAAERMAAELNQVSVCHLRGCLEILISLHRLVTLSLRVKNAPFAMML